MMTPSSNEVPERCALCGAVRDAMRSVDPLLFNSRLFETDRFLVLPSLGPLVPGHVMIVSKLHFRSLASMGSDAIFEYNSLSDRLRNDGLLGDDILEAEHGSAAVDKAGACVVHTHIHMIPGMGRFCPQFKARYPLRPEGTIFEIGGNHAPYIYVRGAGEQAIFDAWGLPSQSIRRTLCDIMDRADTDWTQAPRLDWVKETVEMWPKGEPNI